MNFLFSIIPTLFVLGILIVIHEYGHFLACRMCKVKVEKFSIGFGPEMLRWVKNGTTYVISLFPLGGFVKPAGESVSEVGSTGPKPGDYLAAPLFSRIFIVIAGVLMNYMLAFVLFAAVFMIGKPVPGTTIGDFMQDFPGISSGLAKGDRILEVNGHKVSDWMEMTHVFDESSETNFTLTVQRGSEQLPVTITPKLMEIKDIFGHPAHVKRLGITPDPKDYSIKRLGFFAAIEESLQTVVFLTVMTHKAIFYLFQGKLSLKTISGPLGIISMAGVAAQMGVAHVLNLTANLSVSLAVINLFPIPALDGGHLLFLLIEGIRRRPVSLPVQERMTQVGFALLLMLMAFIIYNDIVNFEYVSRLKGLFGK
ncbi:MAG: RIP metalloprotease RseP [Candidatus Omnitrophica bacterium]|nr:RIP metalloprotease RseP [Candidatus Omnitrophota bacterium]